MKYSEVGKYGKKRLKKEKRKHTLSVLINYSLIVIITVILTLGVTNYELVLSKLNSIIS